MNKEKLIERKKQLEQNKEMAIAQLQQLLGAIAIVEDLLKELETEESKEVETPVKKSK